MKTLYDVIKRPLISEKSTALAEVGGKYSFEVATQSNKQEIRQAVEALFNVKVRQVRTVIVHGKVKRFAKSEKKLSNWKKAIVTLGEGQKIDFFNTK